MWKALRRLNVTNAAFISTVAPHRGKDDLSILSPNYASKVVDTLWRKSILPFFKLLSRWNSSLGSNSCVYNSIFQAQQYRWQFDSSDNSLTQTIQTMTIGSNCGLWGGVFFKLSFNKNQSVVCDLGIPKSYVRPLVKYQSNFENICSLVKCQSNYEN